MKEKKSQIGLEYQVWTSLYITRSWCECKGRADWHY